MKPAIVGCCVGLHVGQSGQPDTNRPSGINNLHRNCRECRVSTREEPADESLDLAFKAREIPQGLHLLGLA
jgi:hypothetical protein